MSAPVAPRVVGVEEAGEWLAAARRVVVVPGLGLGLARAEHLLGALVDVLDQRGADVRVVVHPLAGRVPGFLDLLLDLGGVPPTLRVDLPDADALLARADLALVVGASDLVDPAARTTPSAPTWGMPIADVGRARQVLLLRRTPGPPLDVDPGRPAPALLPGDARTALAALLGPATGSRALPPM